MSGHTPGPWVVSNGRLVRVRPKGSASPICGVHRRGKHTHGVDDVETLANARLIAAAPETAAELERVRKINAELVQALRRIAPLPQMHGKGCGCAVCEAHAALAKHARAETSDAG